MDKAQFEKLTKDYQQLQEQLRNLALQREQFTMQNEEYKEALASIQASAGKVYYAVGGALVESNKDAAAKDIKEKQESLELRLSIMGKQYEELSKREQALRTEITNALKATGAAGPAQ
ncbi:MAG: prefoldin subunit [Candidatus Marsarchaeota archaeon]|nr:prefoldin subunit [Candidatus Marsarchaeota archaeon]